MHIETTVSIALKDVKVFLTWESADHLMVIETRIYIVLMDVKVLMTEKGLTIDGYRETRTFTGLKDMKILLTEQATGPYVKTKNYDAIIESNSITVFPEKTKPDQ